MSCRRHAVARLLAVVVLAGASTGCARTRVTWRSGETFPARAPDAQVELFVRSSLASTLRDAMTSRGASEVSAFPPGIRIAEIEALDAPWLSWDAVLDEVRGRARREGADRAVATGGASGMVDGILLFQLLRSFDAR